MKESSEEWGRYLKITSSSVGELSTLNIYIFIFLFNMFVYIQFKYSMAHNLL
jgi:hypothetical protein